MPPEFTVNKILQQMESIYDERLEISFASK
jgi:hypothetical protein